MRIDVGKVRAQALTHPHGQAEPYVVTVEKEATLGVVLERLVSEGVHRVYVVDGKGKPEGVVTLTGVCFGCARAHSHAPTHYCPPPPLCRRVGYPGCVIRVLRLGSRKSISSAMR